MNRAPTKTIRLDCLLPQRLLTEADDPLSRTGKAPKENPAL